MGVGRILSCLGTLSVLVVLAAHRANAAADATQLLADWSAAVQQHVPGTVDSPLRFVWRLTPAERSVVASAAPALVQALSHAQNAPNAESRDRLVHLANDLAKTTTTTSFIDRAVMLHADAAMFDPQGVQAPAMSGRSVSTVVGIGGAHIVRQEQAAIFATARDGEMTGRAGADWNWPFARRLLAADPIARSDAFASKWYHATTSYLFINAYFGEADAHLRDAAAAPPDDPLVLFDRGCIAEALAGNLFQFVASDDRALQMFNQPSAHKELVWRSVELPSTDALNARAEDLFQRALGAEPRLFEAEVRLSRLLDIEGRHAEALEHARLALEMRPPADVAFHAHLFAARSAVALGRLDDAQGHIDAALTLFPKAQSALLAASHVALLNSDAPTAFRLFGRLRDAGPEDRTALADPWILYCYGAGRLVEPLLSDLWRAGSSLGR
jgi:tetratricopeptide (TPR) repeat protein